MLIFEYKSEIEDTSVQDAELTKQGTSKELLLKTQMGLPLEAWKRSMLQNRRPQYLAIALGWIYNGLLLGLAVAAVFSPEHTIVLNFNQFGELWADVVVFTFAFLLMTWLLFLKLPQRRHTDRRVREDQTEPTDQ